MKVAIIGATGSIGRTVTGYLLNHSEGELVLISRNASSLALDDSRREVAVDLDAADAEILAGALAGVDAVFVAVSGALVQIAHSVTVAMGKVGIRRLIFISSMGIYDEIPVKIGADGNLARNPMLRSYRDAADIVEASGLDTTVIRPGWFDDGSDDSDYQVTSRDEPFGGHDVSRVSIANLVFHLLYKPNFGIGESLGINRW